MYECAHPYQNNMDTTFTVSVPNARKYKIVFDPLCSTEPECDKLIFTDASGKVVGVRDSCTGTSSLGWLGAEDEHNCALSDTERRDR